ncbi:thymidylate synthase [Phormidium sp. CCY1219]|uniref:thymidylate synthase n=1 Tax=Phormidium sp. CCY1219 TaxID=2886104 RepID=UPI002D1F2107|nr:thymidylate synthase [Phormidium sp. CCY1219]MEB3827864.1 thymidylate synthase [Phormidium sp. CCY1219]
MTAIGKAKKFEYNALYKPNQLICGRGQTAMITGWTVKQAIAKQLDPHEYAVIGQLYSPTRGISLLIRNLLANPHVRYLVALNATKEDRNAGGCQCLIDFFRNGFTKGKTDTGRDCWTINSPIPGYIDIEIPVQVLEQLRSAIKWKEASNIAEAISEAKNFASKPAEPWSKPLEFPMATVTPTVLPGPRYGHRIEGKTIAETWVKIIHRIKTTGTIRPTGYDGKWQELIDLMAVVTDEPPEFYFPDPNYLPIDREFLKEYVSQILDDAPYAEGVKYTYGQRLRSWFGKDQVEQVIEKLIGEIDAASGVMSLWDVRDHDMGGSPCLNHIWVRVVENELSLTAVFRSNDMFSAWPANAMGLRALQQHIRNAIAKRSEYDLKMGPLMTLSQSAHIYDDTWDNADKLIKSQYAKICQQRDYADESGNFAISVKEGEIIVEHTTPGSGEVVNCYCGFSAGQLSRQIAADCPTLQVEHALYLGSELQKAEVARLMKNDRLYEQDKPLKKTPNL